MSLGANSALVGNIIEQLGIRKDDEAENVTAEPPARSRSVIPVHLYPADCSTVMNMMKALVTGFVDRGCEYSYAVVRRLQHI